MCHHSSQSAATVIKILAGREVLLNYFSYVLELFRLIKTKYLNNNTEFNKILTCVYIFLYVSFYYHFLFSSIYKYNLLYIVLDEPWV